MTTTRTNAWIRIAAAIVLMASCSPLQAGDRADKYVAGWELDQQRRQIRFPRGPARQIAKQLRKMYGYRVDPGECGGDIEIGPVDGMYTPLQAWLIAIKDHCPFTIRKNVVLDDGPQIARHWRANRKYDFRIDQTSRVRAMSALSRQTNLLLGYSSTDDAEEQELVGPVYGRMTLKEALALVIGSSDLVVRWIGAAALIDSRSRRTTFAHRGVCRCSFGLPEYWPSDSHVTVTRSRLHSLDEHITAPVLTIDSDRIEAIGAATVPDLLRHISQTAFARPEGFLASGAQYAELRGYGADTTLVTIDGVRTLPSANNIHTSAFDLNTVPITAVERVEVLLDSVGVRYGADAIGGMVNIVLRKQPETPTAEVRYATAQNGARQRRATLSAGVQGDRGRANIVVDAFELGGLLGRERGRSRDQDYRRFAGGADRRLAFGAPASIRSVDGRNLPGLDAPFALVPVERADGALAVSELLPGERTYTSLSSYQSLVPEGNRLSFAGTGELQLGDVRASLQLIGARRRSVFDLFPPTIAGGLVGAAHPGNPFPKPVVVDVLLTGMGVQQQIVESSLVRGVAELGGPLLRWTWGLSVLASDERATAWIANAVDQTGVMQSLIADDAAAALDVFAAIPGSRLPAGVLAPRRTDRFSSAGTQVAALLQGPVASLTTGEITVQLGGESRRESMEFSSAVGAVHRDVTASFAQVKIPLVDADRKLTGAKELSAVLGVRRDDYSDVGTVTSEQYGLHWRPHDQVKFHATLSHSYRPPPLFDMYLPRIRAPIEVFDARRNEGAAITVTLGGNTELRPVTAKSQTLGVTFGHELGTLITASYFRQEIWDRIAIIPMQVALASESSLPPGRVVRADPTPADIASGRLGALLLVDISRDNIGGLTAAGVDLSVQRHWKSRIGRWSPRLDITRMHEFRFSDLPNATMTDRIGLASDQGSIPRWRAVGSLTWEHEKVRAATHFRYSPSYDDSLGGQRTTLRISSQIIWDLTASMLIADDAKVSIGVENILDARPDFATVDPSRGYDTSQGDLVGRRAAISLSLGF